MDPASDGADAAFEGTSQDTRDGAGPAFTGTCVLRIPHPDAATAKARAVPANADARRTRAPTPADRAISFPPVPQRCPDRSPVRAPATRPGAAGA
ncbi:hypothetical protein GCM10018773_22830 [Streptomyces candidus]|nr:hypothetical protein GCM10018773_22830 [Streptomyces candidus]